MSRTALAYTRETTEDAPSHEFEYDTVTARALLRGAIPMRPMPSEEARRTATCLLLNDLINLFDQYGYRANRRPDREWGHVWTITFFLESLFLAVGPDGSVHSWIQPHQGEQRYSGLQVWLTFDPSQRRWMGPPQAAAQASPAGGSQARGSALEELTQGVLTVIRYQVTQ